jgi:acetolactate synthase-1/2/3 large subunit
VAVLRCKRSISSFTALIDKTHNFGIMNLKKNTKLEQVINEELKPTNNKGISMGETIEMINKHPG